MSVPLHEQRDGSYQINLVDMTRPPKVKDQEVEVLQAEGEPFVEDEEDDEEPYEIDPNRSPDPMTVGRPEGRLTRRTVPTTSQ